jgi:AcrR family transcriptional regulator
MAAQPIVRYRSTRAQKTRQEILQLATDIVSEEGLQGLSIGRLASELRMSKTGVFAHFGSKEQLQLAAIDNAKQIFQKQVIEPSFGSPRGIARLKAILENWLLHLERKTFRGASLFIAASAGSSDPEAVRDVIAELNKNWLRSLQEEVAFARSKRQVRACLEPAQLAFELHSYLQEANWAFKLFGDRNSFQRARQAIADRITSVSL